MESRFKESTKDNPLYFFEDFFSALGQKKMKVEFLSDVLPRIDQYCDPSEYVIDFANLDYDLEKEEFKEHIGGWNYETNEDEYQIIIHTYIKHIGVRLKSQAHLSNELLKQRLDSCDLAESEIHVLAKMEEKTIKMNAFLDSSEKIPFKERLKLFLERKLMNNIILSKKSTKTSLKPKSITKPRTIDILVSLLRDLKVFEGEDEISDFIELVINKNLEAEIKNPNLKITCELWVFKKIIDVIKFNFNVKWKYLDIEKSGLFIDVKKGKLITQKRISDAKPKSKQKQNEKFKLIDDILAKKSVF
jgi:hypothetical protein